MTNIEVSRCEQQQQQQQRNDVLKELVELVGQDPVMVNEDGLATFEYMDHNKKIVKIGIHIDEIKVKTLQQSDLIFNAAGDVVGTKD
jgi:hypothetical protein